jgi:hypothetical protein
MYLSQTVQTYYTRRYVQGLINRKEENFGKNEMGYEKITGFVAYNYGRKRRVCVCVCVYTLKYRKNSCIPYGVITDLHVADILNVYKRDILMNVDVFTAAGRTGTVSTGEMTNSTRNTVFFVNR